MSAPSDPLVGRSFGHFRITRRIGAGGMGEVYEAVDDRLGRSVALKVLPDEFSYDKGRLLRFGQEARSASALNHPNIVTVFDIGEVGSMQFIATELIAGRTLRSRMADGPVGVAEAVDMATQTASALAAAHDAGVVHRDIKPENIMVRGDGLVKVLDFGLAKLTEGRSDGLNSQLPTEAMTAPGVVVGTVKYMSPEQARGEKLDRRTDIWSLGVVLYELLSGRNPFEGRTAAEVIAHLMGLEPLPLARFQPDAPEELERIVRKALQKGRDDRYHSAHDLLLDLKALRRQMEVGDALRQMRSDSLHVPGSGQRSAEAGAAPVRGRRIALVAAAVAALVLAAIALALLLPRLRPAADSGIDSIAVLPLQNLSRSAEGEYLADGMTEALIADLAQISALKVISRTSVMQYRNTRKSMPEIGRELGADAVIEGSIAQAGGRVRVTAQLIDAREDRHLWAQSYERDLRDVLRLQDEIARTVADAVQIRLLPQEKTRLTRAKQIDPRAHDLYVRARYLWNGRTTDGMMGSVDLLRQAIAIEPAWPLAHAALADSYNLLPNNGFLDPEVGYPRGMAAAMRAIELDPDLGEAHTALAFALWHWKRDWAGADREFRRAIALQPSYASAHHFRSLFLVAQGKDQEGLAEMRKAMELDPLSPRINTNYGDVLRESGHEKEGIEQLEKSMASDPLQALRSLVFAYASQNRPADAVKTASQALARHHPTGGALQALAEASLRHGAALPLIHEAERQFASVTNAGAHVALAAAYTQAGDRESAWRELDRVERLHFSSPHLLREPLLAPLRAMPRYAAFLKRMNLAN